MPKGECRKQSAFTEYFLPGGKVLKVFHDPVPLDEITRQAQCLRAIQGANGMSGHALAEIVETDDGRYGIVFGRDAGTWMLDAYFQRPLAIRRLADTFAVAHQSVHELPGVPGLRRQRDLLKVKILQAEGLSGRAKRAILMLLQRLPDGNQVCHGDFELTSVVLGEKRATVTDWHNAAAGNPLCDVARTSLLMTHSIGVRGWRYYLYAGYQKMNNWLYLSAYSRLSPIDKQELLAWLVINAAARLGEDAGEKSRILKLVNRHLSRVLSSYALPLPQAQD